MALNISEKKLDDVIDFNVENGDTATCKQFAITPETLARYLRHYENTFKKDYKTRKALKQIGDTFTEKELTSLIKSKTLSASMKKTIKHTFTGDIVTFAHFTDTHIGSKYFDENNLMAAFEECDKYGVDFIVHSGDVTEGFSNRPGHVYELTHIGADQQKEYAIELFSRYNKPIYMIDGNHDRWYIKSAGVKIVKDICKELDHCIFLGHDEGDINVNGVIIKLWHGEDGSSYSTSYRIQKIVEAFTGGEKPHVLCCGHTHKQISMFERNIHITSGGALSYQSSWMRSKRLACHSGFFINKMCIDKKEVKWFQSRWYPFYKKNIEVFNHE